MSRVNSAQLAQHLHRTVRLVGRVLAQSAGGRVVVEASDQGQVTVHLGVGALPSLCA